MRLNPLCLRPFLALATAVSVLAWASADAAPKVILISLDGATPRLAQEFMRDGTIPPGRGLSLLARHGVTADRNVTVHPSLTAPAHIAIVTGASVSRPEYLTLQRNLVAALYDLVDTNPNYALGRRKVPVFDQVFARPVPKDVDDPDFGQRTSRFIGQDSGDVYAVLTVGYNFDGAQVPVVTRLGDDSTTASLLSVPNFYGAHGYNPELSEMSAIFFAAGPSVCRGELKEVRNIDVAPTILRLLDVPAAATVQGRALDLCRRQERGEKEDDD